MRGRTTLRLLLLSADASVAAFALGRASRDVPMASPLQFTPRLRQQLAFSVACRDSVRFSLTLLAHRLDTGAFAFDRCMIDSMRHALQRECCMRLDNATPSWLVVSTCWAHARCCDGCCPSRLRRSPRTVFV